MKKEIAEYLVDNSQDLDLREEYSGRGMYGKSTAAITCDGWGDLLCAIANAIQDTDFDDEGSVAQLLLMAAAIRNLRTDSMGRGIIVY